MISNEILLGNNCAEGSEAKKNLVPSNLDMFVWMSGFHNPLAHTHFNMFVDERTSANESPEMTAKSLGFLVWETKSLFSLFVLLASAVRDKQLTLTSWYD